MLRRTVATETSPAKFQCKSVPSLAPKLAALVSAVTVQSAYASGYLFDGYLTSTIAETSAASD